MTYLHEDMIPDARVPEFQERLGITRGGEDAPTIAQWIAGNTPPKGEGEIWLIQGFRYEEAATDATDADIENVAGVKLYLLEGSWRQDTEAETVSDAEGRFYANTPAFIRTSGKGVAADGQGLVYTKVASEPTSQTLRTHIEGANLTSNGTAIGNLTGGGGLAAAFDFNTAQDYNSSARNSGTTPRYVGKTGLTHRIWSAICWPTTDQGFIQTADPSVTITLYGKTGAAPANATDGTVLGSTTFTDAAGGPPREIRVAAANIDTIWENVWVHIQGDGVNNIAIAELQLFRANVAATTVTPEKFIIGDEWYEGKVPAGGHSIAFGRTGATAELVTQLPISNPTPSIDTRKVIYSLPVNLVAGDLIEVTGEFEVSTSEVGDTGANVGVWSGIILTPNANGISAGNQNFEITETNGRNCTPKMHHDTHVHAGALIAPATGLYYVNLIAWAANSSATGFITVEQDYGHLTVKVTRGLIKPLIS